MMIDTSNMLLVFALEQESAQRFDSHNVLYSGVGKVQATHRLTHSLVKDTPSIVINMGTAGSKNHATGAVVNPTAFVQRDMDVTALGCPPFGTPFSQHPTTLEYGLRIDALPHGICGTGDNFSAREDFGDGAYDTVDMEAYALAHTCQHYGVPFLCLKYISDGADDSAHQDWHKALEDAANALRAAFDTHII